MTSSFGFSISSLLFTLVRLTGRELAKFVRSSSFCEPFSFPEDFMADLSTDLDPEMPRHSVMSTDSGIERDLPDAAEQVSSTAPSSGRLSRRGGMKVKPSVTDSVALMQDALEDTGACVWGAVGSGTGSLQRRAGAAGTPFPRQQQRQFTARVVMMGDDRVVGRMARAYYLFR